MNLNLALCLTILPLTAAVSLHLGEGLPVQLAGCPLSWGHAHPSPHVSDPWSQGGLRGTDMSEHDSVSWMSSRMWDKQHVSRLMNLNPGIMKNTKVSLLD